MAESENDSDSSDGKKECQIYKNDECGSDSEESEERKSKKKNVKCKKREDENDSEESEERKSKKENIKCKKSKDENDSEESEEDSENESENEKECKKAKMKDKRSRKKESEDDSMFEIKKIAFTQNVIDGYWSLNEQTKLLISSKKDLYEQIENILKEKNVLYEENIIITILVLFTLRTNKNINLLEYTIIINKGLEYLSNLNINYEEIETKLK